MDPKNGVKRDESMMSSRAQSTRTADQSERGAQGETENKKTTVRSDRKNEAASAEKSPKRVGVMPRLKRPENDERPMMNLDEMFRKRWHVEGIIGKGGYGEIYLAIDMKRAEEVAIKVEPKMRKGRVAKRMILEQQVLLKMQGKPHVPTIFASGHTEKFNFIILQLLSMNLGDIRRMSPNKRLSKSSVGRIINQGLAALRDLHAIGYLHRDVKPANMCFGITPKNRHVLMLLDFGLVRRYKEDDGEWRAHRFKAGFRGTQRYVSVRVHARLEQTPADDLTSLLYTAIELIAGDLPWRTLEKGEDICQVKKSLQRGQFEYFSAPARELFEFSRLVSDLDPLSDPPYATIQTCVKKLYSPKTMTDPYDWEEDFKEMVIEKPPSSEDSTK